MEMGDGRERAVGERATGTNAQGGRGWTSTPTDSKQNSALTAQQLAAASTLSHSLCSALSPITVSSTPTLPPQPSLSPSQALLSLDARLLGRASACKLQGSKGEGWKWTPQ